VVDVLGEHVGERQVVRVRDHGPGIDENSKEALFYPFYRLDGRNVRLGPGLGLAIAKGFLSLMGGDIWVEETPGGGATFAFSLPAAETRP
jgi:two-component system sensor histidine kinase KdpD